MFVFNVVHALHIDTSTLSDGTYELIQESDGGDLEAQVNTAELTEAPNQSSEEPSAEIVSNYREGKPRTQPIFQIIIIYCYYLFMHLLFLGF